MLSKEGRESCCMERAVSGYVVCPNIYDIDPSSELLVN
jgi:hypothetical protein